MMKRWSFVTFCVVILGFAGCSVGPLVNIGEGKEKTNFIDTPVVDVAPKKTQVVIIGTIHNFHYESKKYKPEVLKEIILALQPDAILNELPLSLVDPNGRPLRRHYLQSPENWAADTVSQELGIKQIPFDQPDRQENFKKTKYFERQKRANKLAEKWAQQVKKDDPESLDLKVARLQGYAGQAEADLFYNGSPKVINSEAHDSIVRIKKSLWYDIEPTILKKYPGYELLIEDYHFARDQWHKRNRIMADNIIKAARQYPGKRLVVVTGATHRYVLRDLLKDEEGIDLKEYWEVIDFNLEKCLKSVPPIPDAGISTEGMTQEEASAKVAKEYWQAIIKGDWELVNKLRPPVVDIDWEVKYSENPPVELIEVGRAYWPKEGRSTGPIAPCIVKFKDGTVKEIKMVPDFRKVNGKTLGFITATWGKPRETKNLDSLKERAR